jgi:hypothetical protein
MKVEAKERKTTLRDNASVFIKKKEQKNDSKCLEAGENERA